MDPLVFFSRYAINLTAAHFPALTARRRAHRTAETEILLFGDSHGWGQGAAGYDAILPGAPTHMAALSGNGFYARLQAHLLSRNGFYASASANRELYDPMDEYRRLTGDCRRVEKTFAERREAVGFYAPDASGGGDLDLSTFGYLVTDYKWTEKLLVIDSSEGQGGSGYVDMRAHASKLFIGVLSGEFGAKLHVYFQNRGGRKGSTAGALYPAADGYPKLTRVADGRHLPVSPQEASVSADGGILIDTFSPDGEEERVYCVDFGQKQRGRLCFAYAGANEKATPLQGSGLRLPHAAVCLRGWRFDGSDVRNFSMGGHTVGQWLGDGTPSFNDDSAPHVDRLLRYVPFTPTLAIVQVPIVNEYLRQTAPDTLASNLLALKRKLSGHLNGDGSGSTDFLLLTTPGDKRILCEGAGSAPVRYEDYYETVRAFAEREKVGLIDFARYFKDRVEEGLLDYELLYDDPIHPGPYVHDFIGRMLGHAVDMVM
ncbi:hypothetical protein ACFSR7_31475 [Cohnella sp. GCM10020058]|uniref:hypothetical protein n=1 Tax=Cohnella sp. GCM10020058 TaxID=3317330 RepID=UPI00362E5E1C